MPHADSDQFSGATISNVVCLDEPGFSSLQSESWAKFAHRISNMLDWTKAAAGLGFRSAADKLKNQQVVH